MNSLHFEEILEPETAAFAAIAGLLVAAERAAIAMRPAVDMDHAGAKPCGNAFGALGITGLDVGRKPVIGVVGDLDRFLFGLEREVQP